MFPLLSLSPNTSHAGNTLSPRWECFVPTLGITRSHAGEITFPRWKCLQERPSFSFQHVNFSQKVKYLSAFQRKMPNICHFCTLSAPPNALIINKCCRSDRFAAQKKILDNLYADTLTPRSTVKDSQNGR